MVASSELKVETIGLTKPVCAPPLFRCVMRRVGRMEASEWDEKSEEEESWKFVNLRTVC